MMTYEEQEKIERLVAKDENAQKLITALRDDYHMALSQISHEIRNPISLINSELQMIEETHPEVASYRYWNDIMDNLEYTKILLNNLSEYNNADRLMPRKTDFHRYLSSLISSIRPTCEYLGIALDVQIPDTLPAIFIDQVKLKQALLNLLRNASEAVSLPGGKISFHVVLQEGYIHISIKDNGCGIAGNQLDQIFQPFVTFKENGTGLGLAITRQIIQAHGGSIQVESTPGQGSEFHILLPETFPG